VCEGGKRPTPIREGLVSVRASAATSQNFASNGLEPFALLERLEHRERQVTRLWERLVERVALFPNPVTVRQHEETAAERNRLRREIADLRSQVGRSY
jgi:hypothetical protein